MSPGVLGRFNFHMLPPPFWLAVLNIAAGSRDADGYHGADSGFFFRVAISSSISIAGRVIA